jgi:hypothetical protein
MHSKGFRVKLIALAFIAIAFPFVVNEWFGASFHKSNFWLLRILTPEYWYRAYAPGQPGKHQIDKIRIVSIARGYAPGSVLGENRCTHRAFMAALLEKLATVTPSLVMIDKWYNQIPSGVCAPGTDGTPKLKEAIRKLSAESKVVIAVGSYTSDELHQFCEKLDPSVLHPEEVVLADYEHLLDFGPLDALNNNPQEHVRWGLARINIDLRKIPLGWMAFQDCDQIATARSMLMPTLAVAGAMLLDKTILAGHNLVNLQTDVTHPYTKLISETDKDHFQFVPAIGLICDAVSEKTDWSGCARDEGDAKALQSLAGKQIIIGETTREDFFHTGEGSITGPGLQANYLASLLSDKSILSPLPLWKNRTISIAWLFLVFSLFYWGLPRFPELAAIASALLTFALGWFFNAVISPYFGVFADLLPPTILEIIGLYLGRRIEMLLEQHKESKRVARKVSI